MYYTDYTSCVWREKARQTLREECDSNKWIYYTHTRIVSYIILYRYNFPEVSHREQLLLVHRQLSVQQHRNTGPKRCQVGG